MSKLQALIFDVDGTMAETERDGHRVAFNHAFAEAGQDWNWSVALYGELLKVSGGKERIRFYLQQYHPDFQPTEDLDTFIANLHATKTKYYQKMIAEGAIPLRPGVKRLIEEARNQDITLAITTTTAVPNVFALLKYYLGADSPNWFKVIAAGDIVPVKKPAPDIYQYVLREMNLPAGNCLAIEDSYNGLQSALQAGVPTVITVDEYTQHQDFSGAKLVLNQLGEPEQPFLVLAGDAGEANYLDLALAEYLVSD
ncbi:MAG: HAD-IA family hydrolase [Coleofasciculaceae cyanobacterium]